MAGLNIQELMLRVSKRGSSFRTEAALCNVVSVVLIDQGLAVKERIRLRPDADSDQTDLAVYDAGGSLSAAIELKYARPGMSGLSGRLDFINDLARLEKVAERFPKADCHAILLTGDQTFWTGKPARDDERTQLADVLNIWEAVADGFFEPVIVNQNLSQWSRGGKAYSMLTHRQRGQWFPYRWAQNNMAQYRFLDVPVRWVLD